MGFAKPKVIVPLRHRDKRYKRLKRRMGRYKRYRTERAFCAYYKNPKP